MTGCSNELLIDVAATAGLYSQVSGVLAGFAFSSIIAAVAIRVSPGSPAINLDKFVRVLVGAFFALIITSVGYAVLAGEKTSAGRVASLEAVAGLAFGFSAVLVVFAIVLMLDEVHAADGQSSLRGAADFMRATLGQGVTVLISLYIYLGLDDYQDASKGSDRPWSIFDLIGLSAVLAQLLTSIIIYRHYGLDPWIGTDRDVKMARVSIWSTTVAFFLVILFGFINFSLKTPCDLIGAPYPYLILLATVALMLMSTYVLARSRIIEVDASEGQQ